MKAKKSVVLVMVLAFSLIFCQAVWADGGVEPPPPYAIPNPIILGSFTATYGDFVNDKPTRFKIHAILEMRQKIDGDVIMIRRQFWFERDVTDDSLPICTYTNDELLKKYVLAPEAEGVAGQFISKKGIAWLLDVKVLEKGDCDNEKGAFIKGSLIIQVKKPQQQ